MRLGAATLFLLLLVLATDSTSSTRSRSRRHPTSAASSDPEGVAGEHDPDHEDVMGKEDKESAVGGDAADRMRDWLRQLAGIERDVADTEESLMDTLLHRTREYIPKLPSRGEG